MNSSTLPDYYRRDRTGGVTAPDLSKYCTPAEHIVRARGKRTKYTSVSLDPDKIDDFGPKLYLALCSDITANGHAIIYHDALLEELRSAASAGEKMDRLRALQAQRYARRRREGLIDWAFDVSRIERKELINWAFNQVQAFFRVI